MREGDVCFWGGEPFNVWVGNGGGCFYYNGHCLWCCGIHWQECEKWIESKREPSEIIREAEKIIGGKPELPEV